MISKNLLSKILFYSLFVFLFVWLVLILRSASLIWIHKVGMIGYTPWGLFRRQLLINSFIAAIQTLVLLPGIIIFLKKDLYHMKLAAISLLPLCILNLFIEPIGIWTMYYSWGAVLVIGTVFLFPLSVYLILFFFSIKQKTLNVGIHPSFIL